MKYETMRRQPYHDMHTHLYAWDSLDKYLEGLDEAGCGRFCALSSGAFLENRGWNNLALLKLKTMCPDRAYAFAALDYPDRGIPDADEMLRQVKLFDRLGFDGFKMMDGKPNHRVRTGASLDDPRYDPMFSYLEERGLPVVYHVNDPRRMWDASRASAYALKAGWVVGPEAPTFDEILGEALRLLDRHPRLRVSFAHMFFSEEFGDTAQASAAQADDILARHPNISFDLAPGMMVEAFAAAPEVWRPFLVRNAERILFGTDYSELSDGNFPGTILRFYETDDSYVYREKTIQGIRLPEDTLDAILRTNFLRFAGSAPRAVDAAVVPELVEHVRQATKINRAHADILKTTGEIILD